MCVDLEFQAVRDHFDGCDYVVFVRMDSDHFGAPTYQRQIYTLELKLAFCDYVVFVKTDLDGFCVPACHRKV